MLTAFHFSDLGLPLAGLTEIYVNEGKPIFEGAVCFKVIASPVRDQFRDLAEFGPDEIPVTTRVFGWDKESSDEIIAEDAKHGHPLIVQRAGKVIINFDLRLAQSFQFTDSKRPIYTYVPGFNMHKVPAIIRRPVSNVLQSFKLPQTDDVVREYSNLPLTGFEVAILLLHLVLRGSATDAPVFNWPEGKRAVFISLHDIDTIGFLQRKEADSLYQVERKHGIRATWFVPTKILRNRANVDFLIRDGNELGWHDDSHDHRLPYPPYAGKRARILENSILKQLSQDEGYALGMRTPKLLKSNHLYEEVEKYSPTLRYDTSFLRGLAPYSLWTNGRANRILEIPTTVPTDIRLYNQLSGVSGARKYESMLNAQIARTKKLLKVGAVISIVTHPELDLSERPELLEVYDQYLSFIRTLPDLWFATAGELYNHWTGAGRAAARSDLNEAAAA